MKRTLMPAGVDAYRVVKKVHKLKQIRTLSPFYLIEGIDK